MAKRGACCAGSPDRSACFARSLRNGEANASRVAQVYSKRIDPLAVIDAANTTEFTPAVASR